MSTTNDYCQIYIITKDKMMKTKSCLFFHLSQLIRAVLHTEKHIQNVCRKYNQAKVVFKYNCICMNTGWFESSHKKKINWSNIFKTTDVYSRPLGEITPAAMKTNTGPA